MHGDGVRFTGCCAVAAVTAVVIALLAADRCLSNPVDQALPGGPAQVEPTPAEILYSVSADDERWYHVLKQKVKMDESSRKNPPVAAMLASLDLSSTETLSVQPIVRHLVTHPGSTSTEYRFGVAVLAAGFACQVISTVLLHSYFAGLYAVRGNADVPAVRQSMSHIQQALAGYLDQLSYFGAHPAVEFMVQISSKMNAVFAQHDENLSEMQKGPFLETIKDICRTARALLSDRCVLIPEKEIAKIVHVSSYNEKIFTNRTEVEDHQLLEMIETLDDYDYVNFSAMDRDFWIKRLEIKPYEVLDDEPLLDTFDL